MGSSEGIGITIVIIEPPMVTIDFKINVRRGLRCMTLFPVLTLQKIFQKSVGIVLDTDDNYGYSYGVEQQNNTRNAMMFEIIYSHDEQGSDALGFCFDSYDEAAKACEEIKGDPSKFGLLDWLADAFLWVVDEDGSIM